jgi:hypothetical protein
MCRQVDRGPSQLGRVTHARWGAPIDDLSGDSKEQDQSGDKRRRDREHQQQQDDRDDGLLVSRLGNPRARGRFPGDPIDLKRPSYFNTGCCSFGDGDVTGLEFAEGRVRLVRWLDNEGKAASRSSLPRTCARCSAS